MLCRYLRQIFYLTIGQRLRLRHITPGQLLRTC